MSTALNEIEMKVVRMRLKAPQAYEQIGERLGISRQRVHQIVQQAEDKLRHAVQVGSPKERVEARNVLKGLRKRSAEQRRLVMIEELSTSPVRRAILDTMTQRGMTRYQLAKAAGIAPQSFNTIFQHDMRLSKAEALMAVLGLGVVPTDPQNGS